MTETQERFLRSVLTLVPLESVVELHLFPPIRRGTLETGVAVIATSLPAPALAVVDVTDDTTLESIDAAAADPVADEACGNELAMDAAAPDAQEIGDAAAVDESAPGAQDSEVVPVVSETAPDSPDVVPEALADATSVSAPRLRILTASYRHTIKGVERGKWTFDVQVEADAPYEAVELVLRGVRHRSSEPADPELVNADTLGALTAPTRVAPAA